MGDPGRSGSGGNSASDSAASVLEMSQEYIDLPNYNRSGFETGVKPLG